MQLGLKMGERLLDPVGRGRVQIGLTGQRVRELEEGGVGLGRGRCCGRPCNGRRFVTAGCEQ